MTLHISEYAIIRTIHIYDCITIDLIRQIMIYYSR